MSVATLGGCAIAGRWLRRRGSGLVLRKDAVVPPSEWDAARHSASLASDVGLSYRHHARSASVTPCVALPLAAGGATGGVGEMRTGTADFTQLAFSEKL